MKKYLLITIALLSLLAIIQCKSDKQEEKQVNESLTIDSENEIMFLIPSADEIINEIFSNKTSLNPAFVYPLENSVKYIDTRYQAMALGVYIADFTYLSFTDDKSPEIEYLKVIRDLSEKVNLFGLIDEQILNRIQTNMMNGDSLQTISQELYVKLSDILKNTDRNNILTLVTTGTIVESLYLASMNITDVKQFEQNTQRLFEQKYVFENFYEFAMQYSTDEYVKNILADLNALKVAFEKINSNMIETKVTRGTDNNLKIEGGTEFIVDQESFQHFKNEISAIRNRIVLFKE